VVVLGDGSITATSDDPEALDQFEALVQALLNRAGYSDRYFSIFPVRHTSAAGVAQTLQEFFRASSPRSPSSARYSSSDRRYSDRPIDRYDDRYGVQTSRDVERVVIVPDERLNTLLVQGSRTDRAKVASLLKILDTDDVPPTLPAHKPKVIPIENMEAGRIAETLGQVFQSRLAGSGRSSPSGAPRTAAHLVVDELTNSLIVTAPAPLSDDVIEFALSLDQSAGEAPARNIKFIQLKRASTARVQEALGAVLNRSVPVRQAPTPSKVPKTRPTPP